MKKAEPLPEIFWEIHSKLPREGPGDDASTRKAFSMLTDLPNAPCILDVGCGPGMQTLELARVTDGSITALDTHQPFLDELATRAKKAGVRERIPTVRGSMFAMPFLSESFDLIWSEGAIYFMGLHKALTQWKPLLRARGYIVGTEPCWLKKDIPDELRAFWRAYPRMTTVPRDRLAPPFGRPGCALNRPTWSPVKWQFRSRFTIRSATVVRQRFFGIPATDTDIISAQHFWTGGLETAGPGRYDAVAIA